MSLFDSDVDIAGAEELRYGVPVGTFEGIVFDVSVQHGKKHPDERYLVFKYEFEEFPGLHPSEWMLLPQGSPDTWGDERYKDRKATVKETYERARSVIKARLESLDVPPEAMNKITPDQLIGLPVMVTMKPDRQDTRYTRVAEVTAISAEAANPVALPDAKPSADIPNPFAKKGGK